jgi:hypothetical protein
MTSRPVASAARNWEAADILLSELRSHGYQVGGGGGGSPLRQPRGALIGRVFWVRIGIRGLHSARELGQPCATFVQEVRRGRIFSARPSQSAC